MHGDRPWPLSSPEIRRTDACCASSSKSFYAPAGSIETNAICVSILLPSSSEIQHLRESETTMLPTAPEGLALVATLYRYHYPEAERLLCSDTLLAFIRSANVKGSFQASGSMYELAVWCSKTDASTSSTCTAPSSPASKESLDCRPYPIASTNDSRVRGRNTSADRAKSRAPKADHIKSAHARGKQRTTFPRTTNPRPVSGIAQLAADIAKLHFTRAEHEAPLRRARRGTLAVGAPPRLLSALGASDADTSEDDAMTSLEIRAALRGWNFGSLARRGEFMERIVP